MNRTMLPSGLTAHRPRRYRPQAEVNPLTVPAGTLADRVSWVNETEDDDLRMQRADAVFNHAQDSGEADSEGVSLNTLADWLGVEYAGEPQGDGDVPQGTQEQPGDGDTQSDASGDDSTPQEEPIAVPEGSVGTVLEWVDKDVTRAQAALDAENAKDKPRATLVKPLADLIVAEG